MPDGFLAPARLWLLVLPALLLAAYVVLQRRRPAYALRFTELDLLASLVPRSAAWRRHVPAALVLLSIVALTTAFALLVQRAGQVEARSPAAESSRGRVGKTLSRALRHGAGARSILGTVRP